MDLALRGACTDGAPGDQVTDVLRRDHVEELAARGHAQAVDLHQQLARDAQALVDAVALVEVGVVDQALPAHRRARLLEVHAHDDFERVLVLLAQRLQAAGVVQGRDRVVDGARADHHQQPVVAALHDVADGLAGAANQLLDRRPADREEADEVLGRGQGGHVLDPFVIGLRGTVDRRIPGVGRGGVGGVHGRGVLNGMGRRGTARRKKTAGGSGGSLGALAGLFSYAFASPPPVRCENQK